MSPCPSLPVLGLFGDAEQGKAVRAGIVKRSWAPRPCSTHSEWWILVEERQLIQQIGNSISPSEP